ncbi:SulP family inorganic anion transporter (plasmid) [Deinococcus radiomollis]|uniref:SulP family inorganic anion transporter n=1 Tax=Deinococcus radiomollis TaxID=468916 RepID=UPI003891B8B7
MGYTKIAGTPVVTGLYTILLPIVAFALLGSSRHLVVGADSATAAILFAGLTGLGLASPGSAEWLTLASLAALLIGAFLLVASVLRLGFLADFLSRTVLVGFLSGIGVSLLVGELPDMLGVRAGGGFIHKLMATVRLLPTTHLPTLVMALSVLAVILGSERLSRKIPGALIAVAIAIAVTSLLGLDRYGIATVGSVRAGLPTIRVPPVSLADASRVLAMSISMFLVIVAQSAATARSFAQQNNETLNENRDLVGLGVANILAGLSSTFVVNGSPTKTAVVGAAGGRTQVSQLTTAAVTLVVLLLATSLIAKLPTAALAALVFLIGLRLIDVGSLRQIYHFRRFTFFVALAALVGVVLLGVERGIFLAIGLSILDHLRQEYHPKDVVLTRQGDHWRPQPAEPGVQTGPGLIVYRFEAPLFFANADYFEARLEALIHGSSPPVRWAVLDFVSTSGLDYTAGLTLASTLRRLQDRGVTIALAEAGDIRDDLERIGIIGQVGAPHMFESVGEALEAYQSETKRPHPWQEP